MPGGAAADAPPPINDLKNDSETEKAFQTKAPANRGGTEAQPQRPATLRFERRGRMRYERRGRTGDR